jgi:mono/diheme cytochrome c family protein
MFRRGRGRGHSGRQTRAMIAFFTCNLLAGCSEHLEDQPRLEPYEASAFFSDGMASRLAIEGTVARGELATDELLHTGKSNGALATEFPIPITAQVLSRGRERFNIYCAPCHDPMGHGNGMVVQRGFPAPPSYHIERLRAAPHGHFFDVLTNGFGKMPRYSPLLNVHDRWAIAAYVRALQFSQSAALTELPPEIQQEVPPRP